MRRKNRISVAYPDDGEYRPTSALGEPNTSIPESSPEFIPDGGEAATGSASVTDAAETAGGVMGFNSSIVIVAGAGVSILGASIFDASTKAVVGCS
jgi:hypothetical protein